MALRLNDLRGMGAPARTSRLAGSILCDPGRYVEWSQEPGRVYWCGSRDDRPVFLWEHHAERDEYKGG